MNNSRAKHSPIFKAKVALAAIREQQTVPEIAQKFRVHASQVYKWKQQFLDRAATLFEHEVASVRGVEREEELLKKIGELTVERDFLAKGLGRSH